MSHTPLPWRTECHPLQKGEPATLIMQKDAEMYERWIAECPWGKDSDTDEGDGDGKQDCTSAEAQANAKFIVRAVNAHDDLLDICRQVVAGGMSYPKYLRDKAAAAITKATGGAPCPQSPTN